MNSGVQDGVSIPEALIEASTDGDVAAPRLQATSDSSDRGGWRTPTRNGAVRRLSRRIDFLQDSYTLDRKVCEVRAETIGHCIHGYEQEIDMDSLSRKTLLAAALVGIALGTAGCDQRNSGETVGQKLDRAADKVAAKTDEAATKTAEVLDDTALTAKVKAAILQEPGLHSLQIGVETRDAVVTLSGTVDTPGLKERAKQIAGSVSGVRGVVDNIATKMG
jgi:hyperosmotically inducible protein